MSKIDRILGKNVYLKVPPLPDSKLELPEEVKEQMLKEFMDSLDELEVYGVGSECTWDLKPGDMVMINPSAAKSMIHFKIGEQGIAAIFEYHILHVFE